MVALNCRSLIRLARKHNFVLADIKKKLADRKYHEDGYVCPRQLISFVLIGKPTTLRATEHRHFALEAGFEGWMNDFPKQNRYYKVGQRLRAKLGL